MRRIIASISVVLVILLIAGYAAGVFTGEVRKEESCLSCRATRYSGTHYGFGYSRVEDSVLTTWYQSHVNGKHGLDPDHQHNWKQSACIVNQGVGFREPDYECIKVPPIFLLRPEIIVEVLNKAPESSSQVGILRALNTTDRALATKRIRLMIEFYYIDRKEVSWSTWWSAHASDFGM